MLVFPKIFGLCHKSSKASAGFTMIELLVVIAIFGIVMPTLAASINNLTVLNNRARDLALANLVAESKAENLRNAGFNSLSPGTVSFSDELPNKLGSPKTGAYTVTIPEPGLAEINLTINYRDYSQTKTIHYKTVVSELGVGQ